MTPSVHGLHHVTAIAADPRENLDFYVGVLGLRLVKRTVNQDAPDTYHLFYADAAGTPGTDLTFFPWPDTGPARGGAGLAVEVPFAVPPGTLPWWEERLREAGVEVGAEAKADAETGGGGGPRETRFGERVLPFRDPHGLGLALVETDDDRPWTPWEESPVPVDRQLRGMHAARLLVRRLEPTRELLEEVLGFEPVDEDGGWHRFRADGGGSGRWVEVKERPEARLGGWGTGAVHHVAWRVRDDEEQRALRERVAEAGLEPTRQIDRFWFRSVYFKEPGGVLFELATDGPGFTRDESAESLGETLILPPWMEDRRDEIEASLPPL